MVKKISKKYLFDRGVFIPSRLYKLLKEMYDDIQELKGETTSIDVTVTDGDDSPIEGAAVTLTDSSDNTKVYTCTTDSSGEGSLSNVAVGTYVVTATASGYKNYTGSEALVVTSDTSTLDIEMEEEEPQPTSVDIGVTVTDGTNPIENAEVTLTDSTDDSKTFTGTTNASGICTLDDVDYGSYIVTAEATGFVDYTGSEALTVTSETTLLSIEMEAEPPVPTTVNIAVTVKNGEDTAIEGATVVLTDTVDSSKTFSGTTGSAGGCNITSVPTGTYVVTATATGYENYTGSEPLTVTSETTTLAVVMTAS